MTTHLNTRLGETMLYSVYYAPRGRQRLYLLAGLLSQRYLYPSDLLVGILGAEGAGKSTLIKGLFPGLELTNDDDGVNLRPTPLYEFSGEDFFAPHTFHLDIRYELAFHQKAEIIEAIDRAVRHQRRVVVEHFDLIYEALGYNAQILFGIGEEVVVARPAVFGPFPAQIKAVVDKTIRFRRMAHSAEDLTGFFIERDYGHQMRLTHSDVKHGFVLNFPDQPNFDISELESKVLEVIQADLSLEVHPEGTIAFGENVIHCTGPRTHVKSTGEIENFRLVREFKYNPLTREYLLIGMVGHNETAGFEELTKASGFDGGD